MKKHTTLFDSKRIGLAGLIVTGALAFACQGPASDPAKPKEDPAKAVAPPSKLVRRNSRRVFKGNWQSIKFLKLVDIPGWI